MKRVLLTAVMLSLVQGVIAFNDKDNDKDRCVHSKNCPSSGFRLQDLKGSYAYSFSGAAFLGEADRAKVAENLAPMVANDALTLAEKIPAEIPIREVGVIKADGKGSFQGQGKMMLYGRMLNNDYDCTYSRDPKLSDLALADCVITAKFKNNLLELVFEFDSEFSLAVDEGKKEARFVMQSLEFVNDQEIRFLLDIGGSARKE